MRKYPLLFCFFFLTGLAFAQVPGYQGKKCVIKYDLGLNHPALVGRTGKLPMVYNNLSMDYVVSRAWTVGFNYGFMACKSHTGDIMFYQGSSRTVAVLPGQYPGVYMQHTASFVAKKFFIRKGYLAPVGRYLLLGVYYQYATDHYSHVTDHYENGYYAVSNIEHKKMVAHMIGLSIGLGRNFVVGRRLVLDLGCTLNFSPIVKISGTEQRYLYNQVVLRNLFQLRLGIGVLA